MIRALVIGFVHALLYAAMTVGLGAWLACPISWTSRPDLSAGLDT